MNRLDCFTLLGLVKVSSSNGILLSCVFTATSEKIAKILHFILYPFYEGPSE